MKRYRVTYDMEEGIFARTITTKNIATAMDYCISRKICTLTQIISVVQV